MNQRTKPLTASERRALEARRSEWLAVGLSTEPADRPGAEAAAKNLYAVMGWREPLMIWMDSPLGGAVASAWFSETIGEEGKRDQLWGQLRDQLGGQLRDQLGGAWWGQHDAHWIAWLRFGRELGTKYDKRLDAGLEAWSRITRSCGWWWPREGVVILTERHRILARDEEGRLHAENGPACAFADGWDVWAWHGVRVPQQVIEQPDSLAAEQITGERNAEVRRVMIERYGAGRYMREAGGKQVQQDDYGALWRIEQPDDEPLMMVKCENSTPEPTGEAKHYWLRVPPESKTAREALAWTFDAEPESYELAVET